MVCTYKGDLLEESGLGREAGYLTCVMRLAPYKDEFHVMSKRLTRRLNV